VVVDGLELEDDAFSRFQFNLAAIAAELERVLINERQLRHPAHGTPAEVSELMRAIAAMWDGLLVGNRHRILVQYIRQIRWDERGEEAAIEFDRASVAGFASRNERRGDG
jgi:hypothetical protein